MPQQQVYFIALVLAGISAAITAALLILVVLLRRAVDRGRLELSSRIDAQIRGSAQHRAQLEDLDRVLTERLNGRANAALTKRLEGIQATLTKLVTAQASERLDVALPVQPDVVESRPVRQDPMTRSPDGEELVRAYCAGQSTQAELLAGAERGGLQWGSIDVNQDPPIMRRDRDGQPSRVICIAKERGSKRYLAVLRENCEWDPVFLGFFDQSSQGHPGQRISAQVPAQVDVIENRVSVVARGSLRGTD